MGTVVPMVEGNQSGYNVVGRCPSPPLEPQTKQETKQSERSKRKQGPSAQGR
jgi:hypothetical protein